MSRGGWSYRIGLVLLVAGAMLVFVHTSLWADPTPTPTNTPTPTPIPQSDYGYQIPIVITNDSGTDLSDTPVAVTINADALVDAGLVQADGDDVLGANSDGDLLHDVVQGMTDNSVTWWLDVDTLADGSTGTWYYHIGDPDAGRDQTFRVDGTSDTVTVADHSDLDITTNLTMEVHLVAGYEPAGEIWLLRKEDAYGLYMDGATVGAAIWPGPVTAEVTGGGFPGDWRIRATYDGANLILYVNEFPWATTATTITIDTNANALVIGDGFNGTLDDVKVGHTSVATPTYVLNLDFEPQDMEETQVGSVANSWTYTGTVEDLSTGTDQDGTYSLTRDMTDITVYTLGLQVKTVPAGGETGDVVRGLIPTIAPDLRATGAPMSDNSLFGIVHKPISDLEDSLGVTSMAVWWVFYTALGGGIGLGLALWSKNLWLFAVPLMGAYFIGWRLGDLEWWIAIVTLLVLGLGVTAAKKFTD